MENKTFTNNVERSDGTVNLSALSKLMAKTQKENEEQLLTMFNAVPVRVDKNLKDNEWYCIISDKMYQALLSQQSNN
ncbi:hypothetical protein KAR91_68585 [Candidatus Pacearchaeota archaeon]|nr:hypothetical protein [Candidatus Pacearchaeota archaeon]